ncbi:hypothetical protein SpCBS45565_g01630 [Spizellomyces sp. 'palustris']|nr:hypothetical protein SpCBS45565_g01630 [Spizellomyces sp. 'palustris']
MADQDNEAFLKDGITQDNFEAYQNSLFAALTQVTKATNFLKANELTFYKSLSPNFDERLTKTGDNLLGLCNDLLAHAAAGSTIGGDRFSSFEDVEDVVDHYDTVVDTVDNLLEKADTCLDEVTGRIKRNAPGNVPGQSAPVMLQVPATGGNKGNFNVIHAQNILRPQLKFEDKIDNSNRPFVRKITHKPNASQPLNYGMPGTSDISPEMSDHLRTLGITDASSSHYSLPHPYEYEIQNIEYPAHMFEARPEELYAAMDQTPYTWIDTEEKLDELAALLDSVNEIAVDTEHHDYRSFQGFVCLIQISTRTEDFIIDALAVRSHLHVLNSSFTNPNIVKVFHGADMDIQWLQRDFGLYIVNLFDTYHASHVLEMAHHGLAFLLKPLPTEMLKYARSDTHYLLYIYDRMRNELLNLSNRETHNLLRATLDRSQQTALKRYEKDIYDSENGRGPNGWRNGLRKYGGALNAEQFAVFRAIHAWRDHIAREEDESQRYVLPNHMLYTLADRMPIESQGVLGCCSPVPPLVRLYASDVALLIENTLVEAKRAKENMEAELKRVREEIAQKEKEWQERKARGPIHIRFEERDDLDADSVDSPVPTPLPTVEPLPISKLFGAPQNDGSQTPSVARVMVTTHSIFSGGTVEGEDEEELAARKMAEQIRKSLYMVAPSADLLLKRKRPPSDQQASAPAATKEESGPKVATPMNVSDISSASSAMSPDRDSPVNGAAASTVDVISLEDEEVEIVKVKGNSNKKRKKNKKSAGLPSNQAKHTSRGQPADPLEAFDYAKARSAVAEALNALTIKSDDDDTPKQRSKGSKSSPVYNPYGAAPETKEKKAPRPTVRPRSGNKSGTFPRK